MVATLRHLVDSSTLQQPEASRASDLLSLAPGQIAGLTGIPGSGLTRLGLALLAPHAVAGPVVYLDVRGWASPLAAWELGIDPEHFVVARSPDLARWGRIAATLLDGARGVYAEVPVGFQEQSLRQIAARARTRRTPLILRPLSGKLPSGVAHLNLEAREVAWKGTEAGYGNLKSRRALFVASGKATRGMTRTIEVEDDGTNDLRVVPHLGIETAGTAFRRLDAG